MGKTEDEIQQRRELVNWKKKKKVRRPFPECSKEREGKGKERRWRNIGDKMRRSDMCPIRVPEGDMGENKRVKFKEKLAKFSRTVNGSSPQIRKAQRIPCRIDRGSAYTCRRKTTEYYRRKEHLKSSHGWTRDYLPRVTEGTDGGLLKESLDTRMQ